MRILVCITGSCSEPYLGFCVDSDVSYCRGWAVVCCSKTVYLFEEELEMLGIYKGSDT